MHITSYFAVADKISLLCKENQKLSLLLQQGQKAEANDIDAAAPILQSLLESAKRNSNKVPTQRRHSSIFKKIGTLLYIYAGSMTYHFIQQNMQEALPSLSTIQSIVQSQYHHIEEWTYQFDALITHLKKHCAPPIVTVAEDATQIVKRVEYDPVTNKCVGFVLPLDDDGNPKTNACLATSFKAIEGMFKHLVVSKYAYLYVVQPLKEGTPSFCLAYMGTNNKFTAKEVLQRWKHIQLELTKRGIKVLNLMVTHVCSRLCV